MSTIGGKNNTFNIEPLNEQNYQAWKFRMEILLEEKDARDSVEKEFRATDYTDDKKLQEAKKRDQRCKSYIVQCLDDTQLDIIRDKETAYAMWKSLEDRYEKKGIPGQLMLRRRLMSMKLNEMESLEYFLKEFDDTIRQLKATGADIQDEDIVCSLLLAMPKSFETVITVLENMDPADLTINLVKSKLRSEVEKKRAVSETTMKQHGSDVNKSAAFMTDRLLDKKVCYQCGKSGHFKRDCPDINHGISEKCGFGQRRSFNRSGFSRGFGQRLRRGGFNERGSFQRDNYRNRSRGHQNRHYENQRGNYQGNWTESNVESQEDPICFMTNNNDNEIVSRNTNELLFYIDSGCTDHLINEKIYFSDYLELKNPINIAVAKDKSFMHAVGVGNIKVLSKVYDKEVECTMKNVFYVPNLRRNLLSVKRLEMANIRVIFDQGKVLLYNNKTLIGSGHRNKLYEILFKVVNDKECLNIETEDRNTKLWHKRLGHICHSNLEKLFKNNLVQGIKKLKIGKIDFCEGCTGKMSRFHFGTRKRAKRILEIIHSDVAGPIMPISHDGGKYFVTFIDDFSNFVMVYVIKSKDEVFNYFKEYINMVQAKFNLKVSTLRCDNGREYISGEMKNFCINNGTIIDFSTPYTPEQNGKAERFNRSLIDKARAMILEANMPKYLWNEAVRVSAYLLNRTPTNSLENATPAEIWNGSKPNISNIRVFGCTAYAHVPKQFRNKFDSKAEKAIMVGYTTTGYRLWNIEEQKIIVARDVIFNEDEFHYKLPKVGIQFEEINEDKELIEEDEENNESMREIEEEMSPIFSNRNKRMCKTPQRYTDYELYMAFDAVSYVEEVPENLEEIMHRKDKNMWLRAIEKEIESIEKNNTWTKVKKPDGIEILNTRWVFASKCLEEREEDKYKARLVVKGCAQRDSFNYDELYSPVVKMSTIRMILSIGNQYKYYFKQLDVKTAFLNGDLNENVYIYPPEMIKCESDCVFKLNKALYGLKQASKCWNNKINSHLMDLGFERSETDYCLYIKDFGKNELMYLLLYVDDIIISGQNYNKIMTCRDNLIKNFEIKDKGDLKNFLGLEINYKRQEGILEISQKNYLMGILKRFNFENCNNSPTPIDPKLKIVLNRDDTGDKPVRQLIGCLMYLLLGSRPDISFAVNYLSRFQDKNNDEVWTALKRLLRYLKGTINTVLKFERKNVEPFACFVDSDWAGDVNDRKSVSGYLIQIFGNTITWVTRKQNCIALSSSEAELVALCAAVQDCLWFRKLIIDMKLDFKTFKILEDNQGCIALIKNPENNKRVKHIDLKYNFVCETLNSKIMTLEYVGTKHQLADILTKGLHKNQFYLNFNRIGLQIREG